MIASTSLPQHHAAICGVYQMKEVSQADIRDLLSEVSLETSSSSDAASTQSSSSSKSAEEKQTKKKKKKKHFLKFRQHGKKGSNNHKKSSLLSRVSAAAKAKPKQFFQKLQFHRSQNTLMLSDEEYDCEMSGSLATGQIRSRTSTCLATIPESTPLQEPLPQFVTLERRKRLAKRFSDLLHVLARTNKSKLNRRNDLACPQGSSKAAARKRHLWTLQQSETCTHKCQRDRGRFLEASQHVRNQARLVL
jgi:hypothetical protein